MVFLTKCRHLKPFGFFKNFIRSNSVNFSDRLKPQDAEETEDKTHIYRKRLTHDEVVKFLLDNVVYNKDGIIVTNKPYGVGKRKPSKKLVNYLPQTFNDLFLEDMMEELAERLSVKSLQIAKAPERYASGMIIFTSTDEAKTKITKSAHAAQQIHQYTYNVVSIGQPMKQKLETKFALKKIEDGTDPVILEQWSKNNLKSPNYIFVRWNHRVLAVSQFASLVQVDISNIHWNSLRHYMATKCLSPILGDNMFGNRVQNVMGVPLLVQPSCAPKTPKILEPQLLSALQITKNEVPMIPAHVHLQSVNLPFRKKKRNFPAYVPPPESFTWTCEQLQLLEKS